MGAGQSLPLVSKSVSLALQVLRFFGISLQSLEAKSAAASSGLVPQHRDDCEDPELVQQMHFATMANHHDTYGK